MEHVEGDIVGDRFELIRELDRGSMGTVWLAEHLTLEVRCAVKFIAAEWGRDAAYLSRFHAEARTIAQVQSPHVVRVLDHDVWGDTPYIAMELLQGENLRKRLEREGRLDIRATHRIVTQIARGLTKAHAAGIVHRDLKPENLFLADEDDETVVKLLDFGVATWAALSTGAAGGDRGEGLVGTPHYMSPEQVRGHGPVDHRADLWALAVIAYECLTGSRPFEETISEIFAQITGGYLPVPSDVAPDLPAGFDGWWARAASPEIDRRFHSARELASALGIALGLDDEAASFRPTPPRLELVSQPRMEPSPADVQPRRPSRPVRARPPLLRYPVVAAGLMCAMAIPFPRGGLSNDARADVVAAQAPRAEEVTARPPLPRLARVEVEQAPPPVPTRVIVPRLKTRAAPAPPHVVVQARARPSRAVGEDDAVLDI